MGASGSQRLAEDVDHPRHTLDYLAVCYLAIYDTIAATFAMPSIARANASEADALS